jgi:hypothetical protein
MEFYENKKVLLGDQLGKGWVRVSSKDLDGVGCRHFLSLDCERLYFFFKINGNN